MTAGARAGHGGATSLQRPFAIAVAVWVLVLCFVPDPRPLGATGQIVAIVVAPVRGLMTLDATSGGTDFSFADLAADAAGARFAVAATRDAAAARTMQAELARGAQIGDLCPDVSDLPEGLKAEEFQQRFGGLGGDDTKRVLADIERRLAGCALLR